MAKGSSFEREICKQLSLWCSHGEREDIYWRTAGSGGRATNRAKRGKSTKNSYGDICAIDPIGQPLLNFMVFELKRGYNYASLHSVADRTGEHKEQEYETWIRQAIASMKGAGSKYWCIIHKRDRRRCMIYFPEAVLVYLGEMAILQVAISCRFSLDGSMVDVVGMPLESFLKHCKPRSLTHGTGT